MAVTDPVTSETHRPGVPAHGPVTDRPGDSKAADRAKPLVRWGLGHALPRAAMLVAARKGDVQGRLIKVSRSGSADVLELIRELRELAPIHRGQFAYLTASLPAVRDVLSSNDFRVGFDRAQLAGPVGRVFGWAADTGVLGPLEPPSLLVTNPPDHTRYRKLVTRVFTARAVEALRRRTQQIADELLDDVTAAADGDVVDLVERYCTLLPVTVIAEILGVPTDERERVLAFGGAAAPSLDLGLTWKQFRSTEAALAGFDTWLGEHLGRLRAEPGDDLLSQLVTAEDDGVHLDERELKATAGLVLAAGFETTVNLLGNGVALLCEHRDQLEALRAEPDLWPNAVDEILRYDPPVLLTGRTALSDTEVAGTAIPRGALVTTLLAGANRDPAVFADPDIFDVRRANAKDHVSFSAGRHFCLGAALARMEGDVGLRTLFDRFPDLTLAAGARRRSTRILRGYENLPVRLHG
ncbi:cytochrome P450 [uncultured Jatrophihabitans sp.]|uniref:cytochrome P450 n=1 Tax=uncultured Jatrophihabitans sp. TaxID=1610747 RepID=UPI0035CC4D3E